MPPVLPTERIAHLGTADCCIHPPGRNEMIAITPPKIFSKEVAQNRPPHFPARTFLTARNPSTNRTMRSLVQDLGVKLREMAFAVNRVVGGEHLPRRPPRPVALDDADNGDVAD